MFFIYPVRCCTGARTRAEGSCAKLARTSTHVRSSRLTRRKGPAATRGGNLQPRGPARLNEKHIGNGVFFIYPVRCCTGARTRAEGSCAKLARTSTHVRSSRLTRRKGPAATRGGNLQPRGPARLNEKHIGNGVFFFIESKEHPSPLRSAAIKSSKFRVQSSKYHSCHCERGNP